jgi:hypothetical protein
MKKMMVSAKTVLSKKALHSSISAAKETLQLHPFQKMTLVVSSWTVDEVAPFQMMMISLHWVPLNGSDDERYSPLSICFCCLK